MTGLLASLLDVNADEAAQMAEDLVSEAEDQLPDLGQGEQPAGRSFR
jgi:hypothetical protein